MSPLVTNTNGDCVARCPHVDACSVFRVSPMFCMENEDEEDTCKDVDDGNVIIGGVKIGNVVGGKNVVCGKASSGALLEPFLE